MGLIVLAVFGVASSFISDPMAFLKNVFVFLIIGFIIFFLVRRFFGTGPQASEQNAFKKAAKRSKRRFQHKDTRKPSSKPTTGNVSTLKKVKHKSKSAAHLTVIEGKKGKKKKRASF
jgi:large-conductance mechanosensitive channel